MEPNHILVCVTRQKTCEKLIHEGHQMSESLSASLSVLHVAKEGLNILGNPVEGEALEYLYKTSSHYGADMMLIRSDDVIGSIVRYAKKIGATHLVMGRSRGESGWDLLNDFKVLCPEINIHTILT